MIHWWENWFMWLGVLVLAWLTYEVVREWTRRKGGRP